MSQINFNFQSIMSNHTKLTDSSKKFLKQFGYFNSKLEHNELFLLQETYSTGDFRKK